MLGMKFGILSAEDDLQKIIPFGIQKVLRAEADLQKMIPKGI